MRIVLITVLCLLLVSQVVHAGEHDALIGAGLAYGTSAEEFGVHVQGGIVLSDQMMAAIDVRVFLMSELASFWALNANVQYVVVKARSFKLFALGGVNYATVGIGLNSGGLGAGGLSLSSSAVGLNIGCGFSMDFERVALCPELKIVVGEFDQLVVGATALIRL